MIDLHIFFYDSIHVNNSIVGEDKSTGQNFCEMKPFVTKYCFAVLHIDSKSKYSVKFYANSTLF